MGVCGICEACNRPFLHKHKYATMHGMSELNVISHPVWQQNAMLSTVYQPWRPPDMMSCLNEFFGSYMERVYCFYATQHQLVCCHSLDSYLLYEFECIRVWNIPHNRKFSLGPNFILCYLQLIHVFNFCSVHFTQINTPNITYISCVKF